MVRQAGKPCLPTTPALGLFRRLVSQCPHGFGAVGWTLTPRCLIVVRSGFGGLATTCAVVTARLFSAIAAKTGLQTNCSIVCGARRCSLRNGRRGVQNTCCGSRESRHSLRRTIIRSDNGTMHAIRRRRNCCSQTCAVRRSNGKQRSTRTTNLTIMLQEVAIVKFNVMECGVFYFCLLLPAFLHKTVCLRLFCYRL